MLNRFRATLQVARIDASNIKPETFEFRSMANNIIMVVMALLAGELRGIDCFVC